jgi:hypothetical protein
LQRRERFQLALDNKRWQIPEYNRALKYGDIDKLGHKNKHKHRSEHHPPGYQRRHSYHPCRHHERKQRQREVLLDVQQTVERPRPKGRRDETSGGDEDHRRRRRREHDHDEPPDDHVQRVPSATKLYRG